MRCDAPRPDRQATDPTLREIDVLVEEIAGLSKGALAPSEFHGEFLRRVLSGLAAPAGIIWEQEPSGQLRVACRAGMSDEAPGLDQPSLGWHERSAARVVRSESAIAVPPLCSLSADAGDPNPTGWLLLFCPWTAESAPAGVVEIVQRPGASPNLERGYLRFLEVACELLGDYERNLRFRELRHRAAQWGQLDEFSQRVHGSLDLLTTSYTVANEVRRILGCDRVSLLVRRGSKCRAVAVSGADTLNRRSASVRLLERLAGAAAAIGDTLWYPGPKQELPPQIEEHLEAYVDESHARGLAVLPLRTASGDDAEPPKIVGSLVVESFSSTLDEAARQTATALSPHIALAMRNALEMERLPLRGVLRGLAAAGGLLRGRRLAATALAITAVVAIVAAMVVVPADFTVEARGELQPLRVRDIFAPDNGVVRELRVGSGARVEVDQVLLVLRRPELDLELKRLWGEWQTARKRLAAVESEQLLNRREDDAQRKRYIEMTAQQEELRALIAGLESQHGIVQQQQTELEVRSPLAGELLTWNAEELLEARPVTRGQVLLTVADLEGPWVLELRVPDRRISHLVEARRLSDVPLDVSFALATDPGRVLRGELDRVAMRTEVTEADGAVVLATVRIDRREIPELVPGAGVVARIDCGRRAIGYVWLHDMIDAVRAWFVF